MTIFGRFRFFSIKDLFKKENLTNAPFFIKSTETTSLPAIYYAQIAFKASLAFALAYLRQEQDGLL